MKRVANFRSVMAALIASTAIVVVGGAADSALAGCNRPDNSCGGNVPAPVHPTPSPSPCGSGGCQPSVPVPGTPGLNGNNGRDGRDGRDGVPGAPGAPSNSNAAANSDANANSNSEAAATAKAEQMLDNNNALSQEQLQTNLQNQGFSADVAIRAANTARNSFNSKNTNNTTSQGGEGGKADANAQSGDSTSKVQNSGNSQVSGAGNSNLHLDQSQRIVNFNNPLPVSVPGAVGTSVVFMSPVGSVRADCMGTVVSQGISVSAALGGNAVSFQSMSPRLYGGDQAVCKDLGPTVKEGANAVIRGMVAPQPVAPVAPAANQSTAPTIIIHNDNGQGQAQTQFNPNRPNTAIPVLRN